MFEITRDMVEQVIEDEKKKRAAVSSKMKGWGIKFIAFAFLQAVVLACVLINNYWTAFKLALAIIAFDLIFIYFLLDYFMRKYDKTGHTLFYMLYRSRKIRKFSSEIKSAENLKEKCRLYEEYIEKENIKSDKALFISEYQSFCIGMGIEDKTDKFHSFMEKYSPKNITGKVIRFQYLSSSLSYAGKHCENLRFYEENTALLKEIWENGIITVKMVPLLVLADFCENKGDDDGILQNYGLIELLYDEAEKIDVSLAMPEKTRRAIELTCVCAYCRKGDTGKSAELYSKFYKKNGDITPEESKKLRDVRIKLEKSGVTV